MELRVRQPALPWCATQALGTALDDKLLHTTLLMWCAVICMRMHVSLN